MPIDPNAVPRLPFTEVPFAGPPAPRITLMTGRSDLVATKLAERTGIVYLARHPDDTLSVGMDPADNPSTVTTLAAASAVHGAPNWVALLALETVENRQGLQTLLHRRLKAAGLPVFGDAPPLAPPMMLYYASLAAWAGAALVALSDIGFLPGKNSSPILLTGLDPSQVPHPMPDLSAADTDLHKLGRCEETRAARTSDGWTLLSGSQIGFVRRNAQEPEHLMRLLEDTYTGRLAEERDGRLRVAMPMHFPTLEAVQNYAVGPKEPSHPRTRVPVPEKAHLANGRKRA